jgi:hypothetical protein
MSFEELLQEHIKALNENTKALNAYTKALNNDSREVEVEYTKDSACKFCGISYKTLQAYIADGSLSPSRRKTGTREYFKEKDLIAFCNTKRLYSGDFGSLRNDPRSVYYGR